MDSVAGSIRDQADGIRQLHQGISNIDEMTQQNAALAEESATAGDAMREQVLDLARQVATFRLAPEPDAGAPRRAATSPALASLQVAHA